MNQSRRYKASERGAGLIEILVVVVIMALLACFLLPRLLGGKDPATGQKIVSPKQRAQQSVGVEYIGQINQAISMYRMDNDNANPPTLKDLKKYGVSDEMILDPVTKQPLPYNAQTGVVGNSNGPDSLGGGANLPQIGK